MLTQSTIPQIKSLVEQARSLSLTQPYLTRDILFEVICHLENVMEEQEVSNEQ